MTAAEPSSAIEERLLPQHLAMLREGSALPDDVIAERGYRSVTTVSELRRLGFTDRQARTPALLIPLHDVHGELVGYSLRPDEPRVADGKAIKYEMPKGWRQRLDVPKRCQPTLSDPSVTLYITEGAKKADALAAQGACAVSLNGVWSWRGTNEHGGKTALPDWDSVALNERLARVVFDSDVVEKSSVRFAMQRLKAYLESRGAIVEIICLPAGANGAKQGIDDYLAVGGALNSLDEFRCESLDPEPDATDDIRPHIVVTLRHLADISADCWKVIEDWNGRRRFMFQIGGRLTRLDRDDQGISQLTQLDRDALAFFLERAALFMKETRDGLVPGRLPEDVARDLLAAWEKPVPAIRGIVGTPVLASDGMLVTTPGYQEATELFYEPVGQPVPTVAEAPSQEDVQRARTLLLGEWLVDFPFSDESSRAHAVAAALTAITREMIDGPTPLFAIDAPTPGTGKGLLAETLALLVTGSQPPVMSELRNDEELRKRITSVLLAGAPIVLFDNVSRRLASGVLAAALTAPVWSDRRLGVNEQVRVPNRAIWLATGNNVQLSSEIARRTVWLRIDPHMDRPWEREGFRHQPLGGWVRDHRHELVWGLLVLARHWIAAGRPAWGGKPLGSFESWCDVVGGILQAAEIPGFLTNRDALYRQVDSESEEWRLFVAAWWEQHHSEPVQVADLMPLVRERDLLPTVFATARDDASDRALRTRLGRALAQRRDRWFGEYRIVSLGQDSRSKTAGYKLERRPGDDTAALTPAGPAEVPQVSGPISGSDAGPAGPAGPVLGPEGKARARGEVGPTGAPRARASSTNPDQVPQVPQVPRSDTKASPPAAEPLRLGTGEVPQEVPRALPPPERVPCLGRCGALVPPGQKCSSCTTAAVDAWLAGRERRSR